VPQNDNCILWNGIRSTTFDKPPTETRRRWNTTVSSGIPTNKQKLLLNKSEICCKLSFTEIKFTTKLWRITFFFCYASWICVTKMKCLSLISMEKKNCLTSTNTRETTSKHKLKHHITSQHCWNTVCVLNIYDHHWKFSLSFKWKLMAYPTWIFFTQLVHMTLKWNFKD